jgi:hypothetical protein
MFRSARGRLSHDLSQARLPSRSCQYLITAKDLRLLHALRMCRRSEASTFLQSLLSLTGHNALERLNMKLTRDYNHSLTTHGVGSESPTANCMMLQRSNLHLLSIQKSKHICCRDYAQQVAGGVVCAAAHDRIFALPSTICLSSRTSSQL